MAFPFLLCVTTQHLHERQLVPIGSSISLIGKKFPENYVASRSRNQLPLIRSLTSKQLKTFTGIVWPEKAGPPAEFRNGKRFKAEPAHKLNGQTVESFLNLLKPGENPHYSTKAISGFMVKLPGEEKKLRGFEGVLSAGITYFMIKEGKVQNSQKITARK